jgi:hypothetical protein
MMLYDIREKNIKVSKTEIIRWRENETTTATGWSEIHSNLLFICNNVKSDVYNLIGGLTERPCAPKILICGIHYQQHTPETFTSNCSHTSTWNGMYFNLRYKPI